MPVSRCTLSLILPQPVSLKYRIFSLYLLAAIYYGTQVFNGAAPQNVLVFDSGATGTSAVVAQIDPAFKAGVGKPITSIEIKSVAADMLLSGHSIDIRLARILAERFEKDKAGVRVEPGKAFNRLLVEAIRVKNVLSANTEILTGVEDLVGEHSLSSRVTRDELESACADMVPSVEAVVQEALQKAGLTMNDIALVIPVGGNSRVPFVLQALKTVCGEARVQQTLNAEEAAAKGATLYAAALHATFRLKPFRFKDVVPSGLQMAYTGSDGQAKTLEAYPIGTSHLESHKGVSLRNMEKASSLSFSQLPSGPVLFQMDVSGMSEALEKFKKEKILDSKMKVWMDIDRTGLFKPEPPVALIQVERMVAPKQETTKKSEEKKTTEPASSTTGTTEATTTATPSTTSTAPTSTTPVEPVPVKVMETVALKHEIRTMHVGVSEQAKSLAKSEISKYRANLELQMKRARARNDVESAYYSLRSELEYETFTRWFKPEELDGLRTAIESVSKIVDEDKPEMTREDYLGLLDKIIAAQSLPMDRKNEAETRITVVPEVRNTLKEAAAYANNTLHVFEPEKRAQTNEELESLAKDAAEFEADLDAKLATQASLPDNENPVVKCAELNARAELIKVTMKMLKKKVLPKPAPPVEPATTEETPADQTTTEQTQTEQNIDPTVKEHADL